MRQLPVLLVLAVGASVSAAVPHSFSSGRPVVAQDVNENLVYLDTTQAKKADKTDLDSTKLAVKGLQSSLLAKADTSVFRTLRDTVRTKADVAALNALSAKQKKDSGDLASISAGSAGNALQRSKNLSDLWNKDSARANLGALDLATANSSYLNLVDTARQTILGDKNWEGRASNFPSHYYTNMWPWGLKNTAFVHYYPLEMADGSQAMATFAHLRVRNGLSSTSEGGGINYLLIGGDDSLNWIVKGRHNILAHSGNLAQLKILTVAGGTISGDLHIAGNLTATPKIPVADYVFEPEYKLASLAEVDAYAKANKHLPEVPSASEIGKDGLDLAAMNLILLKKVEELTMHAIAQEKRIEALEARSR